MGFTSNVYGCAFGRPLSRGCKRRVGSVALFVNLMTTTPHLLPPLTSCLLLLHAWNGWPVLLAGVRKTHSVSSPHHLHSFFFSFPTFYFYPCSWGCSPLSCLYDGNTVVGSNCITLYNSAFSNITLVTWNGHGVSIQSGKHNKSVPPLFPNIYQHKIGP